MINKFLSGIDLFSVKDILQPSETTKFSTKLGKVCSLIVWGWMIYVFIQGLQELILRNKPTTVISSIYKPKPIDMNINQSFFPFAVGTTEQLEVSCKIDEKDDFCEECNWDHLFEDVEGFDQAAIDETNQWYCMAKMKSGSIGSHNTTNQMEINLSVKDCNKALTSSVTFYYVDTEIDQADYSNPTKRIFKRKDIQLNWNNYLQFTKGLRFSLQSMEVTTDSNWLMPTGQEEKTGSVSNIKVFTIEPNDSSSTCYSDEANPVVSIVLASDLYTIQKYSRSYKTIYSIFADVSGFHGAVLFLWIVILGRHYVKMRFQQSLFNEIFNSNLPSSEGKMPGQQDPQNEKRSQGIQMEVSGEHEDMAAPNQQNSGTYMAAENVPQDRNLDSRPRLGFILDNQQKDKLSCQHSISHKEEGCIELSIPLQFSTLKQSKQDNAENEVQNDKNQNHTGIQDALEVKKFKISMCKYVLSYIFGCCNRKMKQYKDSIEESLDLVSERLEVSYIVKKLQEINKLERLTLEDEQLILFSSLPKSKIRHYIPGEDRQDINILIPVLEKLETRQHTPDEDTRKSAFKKLRDKERKSEMDKKLLEVFSPRFLQEKKEK